MRNQCFPPSEVEAYRIAGSFEGENFRKSTSTKISRRKLSRILAIDRKLVARARDVCEKTFANGPRSAKFAKVFSLESFPLYGTLVLLFLAAVSL